MSQNSVDSQHYHCVFIDLDKNRDDAITFRDAVRTATGKGDWVLGTPSQLDEIRTEGIKMIKEHFGSSFKAWSSQASSSNSTVSIVMGDEDPASPTCHVNVTNTTTVNMRAFVIRPI